MPGISGLNGSTTLQPTTNVDELLNSQKTDDTKKTETPSDVGKTDKTGAKTELEEVVHDDTALNGQTAENFVKANTVETGKDKAVTEDKKAEGAEKKDKAEKKDGADKAEKSEKSGETENAAKAKKGDIGTWFENHPKLKLAMFILEQVFESVEKTMVGIASKLPGCAGGCVTGGLAILKGLAGMHKLDDFEKDFPNAMKGITKGGEQIANAIESDEDDVGDDPDVGGTGGNPDVDGAGDGAGDGSATGTAKKPAGKAAQIINCVGAMCGELSGAKSWEDALNAVGKSAADIVSATNPKSAEIADAVKANMGNFTMAISRGVTEVRTAIKESDATNDEKTTKALELFEKTLTDDATLSDDEKKLVKALSDGAIKSIKAKHSKKALDAYEETLGAAASAILKGRNKEIAEKTIKLMKELRSEKDPIKATMHALTAAQELTGGKVNALEALAQAVEKVGQKVDALAKGTESDKQVETDAKAILAEAGEKAKKSVEG